MPIPRRDFFVNTALGLTAAAFANAKSAATAAEPSAPQPVGPGDRVRVAVIGVNGQGAAHVSEWLNTPEEIGRAHV